MAQRYRYWLVAQDMHSITNLW